jgi:hypothetical protein
VVLHTGTVALLLLLLLMLRSDTFFIYMELYYGSYYVATYFDMYESCSDNIVYGIS